MQIKRCASFAFRGSDHAEGDLKPGAMVEVAVAQYRGLDRSEIELQSGDVALEDGTVRAGIEQQRPGLIAATRVQHQ